MWPFKPAWQSKNFTKALESVKKLTDQTEIARAAQESKYSNVRSDATAMLTDQAILSKIATSDPEGFVRATAVRRLTNQATLSFIAANETEINTRLIAAEKITDSSLVLKICRNIADLAVKKYDHHSAQRAEGIIVSQIENINDQSKLTELVKNNTNVNIRNAAIAKLTDQNLLYDIAKNSKRYSECFTALGKITDESLISDVLMRHTLIDASEGSQKSMIQNCIGRLKNQFILVNLAKGAQDKFVRVTAFVRIDDLSVITDILNQEMGLAAWSDSLAVLSRITDQSILEKIALYDGDAYTCESVIDRLTNEDILIDIMRSNANSIFGKRIKAARRLKSISRSQSVLDEVKKLESIYDEESRIANIYSADSY